MNTKHKAVHAHQTASSRRAAVSLSGFLIVCALLGAVLGGVILLVQRENRTVARLHCHSHLKQVGLAMANYHDVFKSLPLAGTPHDSYKYPYSWRMRALPFFGHGGSDYSEDQPWNSSHNLGAAEHVNQYFRCPSDPGASKPHRSNYVLITGPGTLFPARNRALKFQQITDGLETTILVVEVQRSTIQTNEPRDLTVDEFLLMTQGEATADGMTLLGNHGNGFHVLMADCSVRVFTAPLDQYDWRALITPAGGETVMLPK